MSDNVMDYLRVQFDRVHVTIAKLDTKIGELSLRVTNLEVQLGNMVASEQSHYAVTMQRLDGIDSRINRIERRLDLTDAPAA
jgi:hypothetical protein